MTAPPEPPAPGTPPPPRTAPPPPPHPSGSTAGATAPPPPPAGLTAPPGAFPPGFRPARLRRVGGLGRTATILVATTAVISVLSVAATPLVRDDARAFLDDDIDRQAFTQAVAPYAIFSLLQVLSLVAAAVVVIVWLHRIASNLRTLHRGTTWGPGWAIGGWFVPPGIPVIPMLTLREAWKASDPDVPVGGDWRDRPAPGLIVAWFVVFGPIQLAVQLAGLGDVGGLGGSERALAEQITGSLLVPVLAAAVDVVAAVCFVIVLRGIGDRHTRLTGERPG